MRSAGPGASVARTWSAALLRIISAPAGGPQHRHELVGSLELASLQAERRHGGECFQLLGRVCPEIDFRDVQAGVPEPRPGRSCDLEGNNPFT